MRALCRSVLCVPGRMPLALCGGVSFFPVRMECFFVLACVYGFSIKLCTLCFGYKYGRKLAARGGGGGVMPCVTRGRLGFFFFLCRCRRSGLFQLKEVVHTAHPLIGLGLLDVICGWEERGNGSCWLSVATFVCILYTQGR